jgi:hypothetical protein
MWYNGFTFFNKQNGLINIPEKDFLSKTFTDNEIELIDLKNINIPNIFSEFILPTEYIELLQYSNGGGIINGEKEFGYFSIYEVRNFYFTYEFPKYVPCFIPIAFNGGGVFYVYDFRNLDDISIAAVNSSNLEYESSVIIGKTLYEVLNKTTNIEEELDKIIVKKEPTEIGIKLTGLNNELKKLKSDKENGTIDLKYYLVNKRRIEKAKEIIKNGIRPNFT